MSDENFPCMFRGDELRRLDLRCQGNAAVFACAHPENAGREATRFIVAGRCGTASAPRWSCTDCLVQERISIDTGRPPERHELPTVAPLPVRRHAPPPEPQGGKRRTIAAQQRMARQAETAPLPPATIVLNADKHGYGDAITTAWISEGSKGHAPQLMHYATGEKRLLLEMLGQVVVDSAAGSVDTFRAYSYELAGIGPQSRALQRGQFLGIHAPPARPPALIPDEQRQWAASLLGPRAVLLFPNTAWGSREWPPFYWIELYQRLEEAHVEAWFAGGDDDPRYVEQRGCFGLGWVKTAALIERAAAVVGNDSGPMHLAGTLDRPTLALLGPTTDRVCSWMRSVIPLAAARAEIPCVGCYFNKPFGRVCDSGCVALGHLLPEVVAQRVLEVLRADPS